MNKFGSSFLLRSEDRYARGVDENIVLHEWSLRFYGTAHKSKNNDDGINDRSVLLIIISKQLKSN